MVYLTGDKHNEFTRLSNKYFKKYDLEIGENDYIIVCGDLKNGMVGMFVIS